MRGLSHISQRRVIPIFVRPLGGREGMELSLSSQSKKLRGPTITQISVTARLSRLKRDQPFFFPAIVSRRLTSNGFYSVFRRRPRVTSVISLLIRAAAISVTSVHYAQSYSFRINGHCGLSAVFFLIVFAPFFFSKKMPNTKYAFTEFLQSEFNFHKKH